MPSTPTYALPYPASTAADNVPLDMQLLAEKVEATLQTLVTMPVSDATFPKAATSVTAETTVDQFTIAAAPYARRIEVSAHVYTTVSAANTQVNVILYADSTGIGYSRNNNPDVNPATHAVTGKYDLPANTAVTLQLRVARQSGTGTVSTSVSINLTNTNVKLVRV